MTWAVSLILAACGGEDLTAPETGDLVIRATTQAPPSGLEQYAVSVDGGDAQALPLNGALTLTALPSGGHVVQLSGVPAQCGLAGDNPRTVTVPVGGQADVDFEVTCPIPVGAVTVTTSTSGLLPDPDGYAVRVDRGVELPIGVNGSLVIPDLEPGPHRLQLIGLAPNCTVEGDNPLVIETAAGTPLSVGFAITCVLGTLDFEAMNSATNADLTEVWGTSGEDVFAVGEIPVNGGERVTGAVQHFDGAEWQPQFRPDDISLAGVWGSAANDVYAVGFHFLGEGAVILHYDGTQWTQTENFIAVDELFGLFGVWGSSATDVFAVGAASSGPLSQSFIVHYDGSSWTRMIPPGETSPRLNDVWGSGPRDVYAAGRDETRDPSPGVILRYDGTAWSPVLTEGGLLLLALWGSSATDVFAVGFVEDEDFNVFSAVRHFDGSSWSPVDVPSVGVLQDVWGSSPTDVYAVGDDGAMLHYDGTSWTESHPAGRSLLGVWGSSPADVFVVGERGTILRGAP